MILDTLAASARERVAKAKSILSADEIMTLALSIPDDKPFAFEKALRKNDLAFICEVKKASPSKSVIAEDFPYCRIAQEYEEAGADCISVLTEPTKFLGSNDYLNEISKKISVPLLRKDFTVDEYMIYEAKVIGASAVLLICALLDTDTIKRYISVCDRLGMSAVVEAHDEHEVQSAVSAGARIIGVNNRNLRDFTVDISNCIRLRSLVPESVVFVAESGIKTAEDIAKIRNAGVNAVLIGETLMRADDKKQAIKELKKLI